MSVATVVVLLGVSVGLTGCFKKWDTAEVEEWYEEKPNNFDDYMRVARQKVGSGETQRGMKLYEDAIKDLEAQFGQGDMRIATAAEELGVLQEKQGMLNEAAQSYRKALEVRTAGLPPTHLDVKRSKQKLASVLKKLGQDDEAKEVLSGSAAKKDSPSATSSADKKPAERVRRHKRPSN